jgi:hypothetical protein
MVEIVLMKRKLIRGKGINAALEGKGGPRRLVESPGQPLELARRILSFYDLLQNMNFNAN